MSTIFKRFAAVLLVLTMVLPLAACKKNNETNEAQKVRDTMAVSVGEHTLSAVMLNYFYMDAVTDWYAKYGTSMGLDISKPLNQQILNESTGKTWADTFMEIALDNIKSTYALYDLAMANDFQLTPVQQRDLDLVIEDLDALIEYYTKLYSSMGQTYPYTSSADYLEAIYGLGSNAENYKEYTRVCTIASAYYDSYYESRNYTNQQLREYEKDKFAQYSSYSFTTYYVSIADYASAEEAKAAAQQLADGNYADKAAFDAAILALPINADAKDPAVSESYSAVLYKQITTDYIQWLAEEGRMPGDMGMIPREVTADGKTTVKGYYVVRFDGVDNNTFFMKNVRHVLIAFQGGILNTNTGETTYPENEKSKAQFEAEKLLMDYRAGSMTELRFADLADKNTDEKNPPAGGLYADLHPGVLPPVVEAWTFDPSRIPGDTTLVESDKGWHLLYFVGNSEITYRDYMLTEDLRIADVDAWYNALLESAKIELLDTTYVDMALVLGK